MKVAKWGNSLAVRLPVSVVENLKLAEGDEIELHSSAPGIFLVSRDNRRERAIERLRELSVEFPPDFKFDREEANAR
jgi:antitoxin MazE